ncbi:MAG TPA: heavy metal sensor histidine kinase [Gammaproteobacteria bacterium]|nr:heavy metal sensor histidine kinase [Gammaproteobacteria bacterium]
MNPSIAGRLAAMFALVALLVFSIIGVALHRVLERELARQQREELTTKLDIAALMVSRAVLPEKWVGVRAKLDTLAASNGGTRFRITSEDPYYTYGAPLPDEARLSSLAGMGSVQLAGREHAFRTLARDIPGAGTRPPTQLIVAIDSRPYVATMARFAYALLAWSAAGVVGVAALGYWVARLGLRPLRRLSSEAHALSPQRLSQRLQIGCLPQELSTLAGSFNGALDRLEAAYAQLEAFNADVAHELRTPLANLIGQTQVALSRSRSADQLEDVLQSNLEELERMRAIVNDMLFLARADQGAHALETVPVRVEDEIAKALDFLELILDEAGLSARIEGTAVARLERALFQRAVMNLLHNAIQHSVPGSEIAVRIEGDEAQVAITVANPGPPLAEAHLARVYDRFFRIDSSRGNSGENHGLGLSIVKAVATMHGGEVYARREGSCNVFGFTVRARGPATSPPPIRLDATRPLAGAPERA